VRSSSMTFFPAPAVSGPGFRDTERGLLVQGAGQPAGSRQQRGHPRAGALAPAAAAAAHAPGAALQVPAWPLMPVMLLFTRTDKHFLNSAMC
jgi:hypothetical protein